MFRAEPANESSDEDDHEDLLMKNNRLYNPEAYDKAHAQHEHRKKVVQKKLAYLLEQVNSNGNKADFVHKSVETLESAADAKRLPDVVENDDQNQSNVSAKFFLAELKRLNAEIKELKLQALAKDYPPDIFPPTRTLDKTSSIIGQLMIPQRTISSPTPTIDGKMAETLSKWRNVALHFKSQSEGLKSERDALQKQVSEQNQELAKGRELCLEMYRELRSALEEVDILNWKLICAAKQRENSIFQ